MFFLFQVFLIFKLKLFNKINRLKKYISSYVTICDLIFGKIKCKKKFLSDLSVDNDLNRINDPTSTIYTAQEGKLFFIKRVKRKGCRGSGIEIIAACGVTRRKSVGAIYVFNARVIGAKQLIKSISRTICCV